MEITVKSQKRRREAPTYPAAAHRARRGEGARANSTQLPGGICSYRAALTGPHSTTCQHRVCLVRPCRHHVTMPPTADSWSSSLTFRPEWLWWSVGRQGS